MRKIIPYLTISIIALFVASAYAAESIVNPTAILGAFEEEQSWLKSRLDHPESQQIMGYEFVSGEIEGQLVVLGLTGGGTVNAAVMTTLMIEHFEPRAVIFSGVAGGINPDHIPGDVVIGTNTIQHDLGNLMPDGIKRKGVRNPLTGERNPIEFEASKSLCDIAVSALEKIKLERAVEDSGVRDPEVIQGVIATGDQFISSTIKKRELRDNVRAEAVEMEGAAVAQVCYQFNVPCLVIRGISDFSDENAEQDFERYYKIAAKNANLIVFNILRLMESNK